MTSLDSLGTALNAVIGGLSFLELQKLSDEHARWGRRVYAKGGFLQAIDEGTVEILRNAMASAPVPEAEVYMLQLGGAVCDIDESATPYAGRAAGHYWIVTPYWDNRENDERCIAWGRKISAQLAARSMSGNYVNEQSDTGIALGAYGKEKYGRLAKLKGYYDPTNLFRLNQNIEPMP